MRFKYKAEHDTVTKRYSSVEQCPSIKPYDNTLKIPNLGFSFALIWQCVIGWVVLDVFNKNWAVIFNGKRCQHNSCTSRPLPQPLAWLTTFPTSHQPVKPSLHISSIHAVFGIVLEPLRVSKWKHYTPSKHQEPLTQSKPL